MKSRRKQIVYLSIVVFLMVVTVVTASFAFFSYKSEDNYIPVNVTVADGLTTRFIATGNTDLTASISGDKFYNETVNNVAGVSTTTMTITITTPTPVDCGYTLVWNWDGSSDHYTKTSSSQNEFTISGVSTNGNVLSETQLNNYGSSTNLGTYSFVTPGDNTDMWTFTLKFYNINANQDAHADKTYKGSIGFGGTTTCNMTTITASDYFALTSTDSSIVTDTHGSYTNYRYTGANPDNYACLTDDCTQKFRIIGLFNEDTHGQSGEQLVKLITSDSLGNMPWDYKQTDVGSSNSTNGSNDWSDSQLMYMLNGYISSSNHSAYTYNSSTYYISDGTYNIYQLNNGNSYLTGNGATTLNIPASVTTTSGYSATTGTIQTLTNAQANLIETVTWHLGGTTAYDTFTASDFYTAERGTTVYSGRPITWSGKIGLMYLSDYGYGTSGGSTCASTELYSWTGQESCYTNDWLLDINSQWTLCSYSSDLLSVFYVNNRGYGSISYAFPSNAVHPSFYLKSSVEIISGTGTYNDPYIFGSGLPDEYQEVEYLQSSGTQYITLVSGTVDSTYGLKMTFSVQNEEDNYIAGFSTINNKRFFFWGAYNSAWRYGWYSTSTGVTTPYYSLNTYPLGLNNKYTATVNYLNSKTVTFAGNTAGSIDPTSFTNTDFYLFKSYSTPVVGRIYNAKLSVGSSIIRNMIPCYRKSDNVAGMYDTINDVFYTNSGTGTFVLGPNV